MFIVLVAVINGAQTIRRPTDCVPKIYAAKNFLRINYVRMLSMEGRKLNRFEKKSKADFQKTQT